MVSIALPISIRHFLQAQSTLGLKVVRKSFSSRSLHRSPLLRRLLVLLVDGGVPERRSASSRIDMSTISATERDEGDSAGSLSSAVVVKTLIGMISLM